MRGWICLFAKDTQVPSQVISRAEGMAEVREALVPVIAIIASFFF